MKNRKDVDEMTPNQLVSWFMIAGYAYYEAGLRVMEDEDFDWLVERLKVHWGEIEHPHRELITPGHLEAATAFDINFPTIAKYAAHNYLKETNASR